MRNKMADATRRPITGSGKLVNYQPVTSILTKNSIALGYDGDGELLTIEINDGHIKKTMTISRNGSGQITDIATVVAEV
jgi:YD repeat-containing protein